jgi:hypothetical protein
MADLDKLANQLKDIIRNTPPDILHETMYTCVANLCVFVTTFKAKKGEPGWSSKVVAEDTGEPVLSSKEQEVVEHLFRKAPWLLEVLEDEVQDQKGGAMPNLKTGDGSLVQKLQEGAPLTGEDVSLDAMFQSFLKKTEEVDKFWDAFAYENPGFAKKLNSDLIVTIPRIPPYIPIPVNVPVPKKPLAIFLVALIDSIRLSAALAGQQAIGLTILVFLEEILTGQWRQALLTGAGFFSPSGVAIGIIAKYMVNAWTLMSPDLRSRIVMDLFQGSKSLLVGFLLWSVNTLTPLRLKDPIARALKQATDKVGEFEGKVKNLEAKASEKLKPLGYRLKFPGLDFSPIQQITMDDLQNIQALARWDTFFCTAEFQGLLKPLMNEPITRLAIELIGVPTVAEEKYALCKRDEPYPSMAEVVMDSAQPMLERDPDAPPLLPEMPEMPEAPKLPEAPKMPEVPIPKVGGSRKKPRKTRTLRRKRLNRHTRKLVQKD